MVRETVIHELNQLKTELASVVFRLEILVSNETELEGLEPSLDMLRDIRDDIETEIMQALEPDEDDESDEWDEDDD